MQIIEYETTKHLDVVPALTKKVVDGVVSRSDKNRSCRSGADRLLAVSGLAREADPQKDLTLKARSPRREDPPGAQAPGDPLPLLPFHQVQGQDRAEPEIAYRETCSKTSRMASITT
jgi:hypothetical protein